MDLLKIKMKTIRSMAVAIAMTSTVLGTSDAFAQVNGGLANGTVDVTVDNAVTVTETTQMTFGSIVIMTDSQVGDLDVVMTNGGAITWPAVGAATTQIGHWTGNGGGNGLSGGGTANNARVFPTGAIAPAVGVFDIAGGAANASMGIIYNNGTVGAPANSTLVSPCGGANLTVRDFTDNSGGDSVVELDGNGDFTLNVGATLRVNRNAGNNTNSNGTAGPFTGYCDGLYTGALVVSAVY